MKASTASDPPTTYAAQRRRAAKAASGNSRSAAIATGPLLREDLRARGCSSSRSGRRAGPGSARTPARTSSRSGETDAVSATIGSNQSMKNAAGTASAASTTLPGRRSCLVQSARTSRNPTNGIQRKIAYVGWTTASTRPAAAVEARSAARRRAQRRQRERERSRHEELPRRRGRQGERNAYVPPDPGAKQMIAGLRARDGARRPGRAEKRPAGLVRDDERERLRGSTGGGGRPAPGRLPRPSR